MNESMIIHVLERCERVLERPSSLSEPEKLRLWRDVGIALHEARRASAVPQAPSVSAGHGRLVPISQGGRP